MSDENNYPDERARLRAFLDTTAYSQMDIATQAGVSLASVSNMYRDVRVGAKVVSAVMEAIDEYERLQPIGGVDALRRLERLEDQMGVLVAAVNELRVILGAARSEDVYEVPAD